MKALIRNVLADECKKLILRHYEYLDQLHEGAIRGSKRLGFAVRKTIKTPPYWSLDPRFNPFKTRNKRVLDLCSVTLDKKLKNKSYRPRRAVTYYVEKEDGTKRELNVFQLPDAAVSRLVYKSLLHKNIARLSAYAYAYREDRSAHDAVHAIQAEWRTLDRVYVAEFDFAKFFDNIDHKYIWRVLDRHGFLCSPEERHVLESFLRSESADMADYVGGQFKTRIRGIPQGTSISLFLANLTCWELDRALERIGVGFARYADDTVVWSESYQKVVQAYDAIKRHSEMMEVPINLEKSAGVSLISRKGVGEISTKDAIDFLGYELGPTSVSIKKGRVQDLKEKISFIAYQNLIQPLTWGIYNAARLTGIDWDYVVALSQIRRYLYGGLDDEKLRKYIRGQIPRINFRGLMSYYPLANDAGQLSNLDGWLIYVLKQSLRKREDMWKTKMAITLPGPTPNWIDNLTNLKTWTGPGGVTYDLRIPSFSLISKAMRVAITKSGISAATHPASTYY